MSDTQIKAHMAPETMEKFVKLVEEHSTRMEVAIVVNDLVPEDHVVLIEIEVDG